MSPSTELARVQLSDKIEKTAKNVLDRRLQTPDSTELSLLLKIATLIQPQTLARQVNEHGRWKIFVGELKPDSALREVELFTQLVAVLKSGKPKACRAAKVTHVRTTSQYKARLVL